MSSVYKEFRKPTRSLPEIETRCPLCDGSIGRVIEGMKTIIYDRGSYSLNFVLHYCGTPYYHGFFRWLGKRGYVRPLFPQILRPPYAHYDGLNPRATRDRLEMVSITCRAR